MSTRTRSSLRGHSGWFTDRAMYAITFLSLSTWVTVNTFSILCTTILKTTIIMNSTVYSYKVIHFHILKINHFVYHDYDILSNTDLNYPYNKAKFCKKVNVKDTFEFWYVFWFCNLNTLQCIVYCTLNLLMYKNSRLYQVACKMS